MPDRKKFDYTFARYAELVDKLLAQLGAKSYALYVMDYGAPVGFRLALLHPERVTALIVQNGNAYEEGLSVPFWNALEEYWADGSAEKRAALRPIMSAESTKLQIQALFRDRKPPTLIVWGKNDPIFAAAATRTCSATCRTRSSI